ncbi:MAG TPA: hypothetical protein VGL40_05635 [Bacillota bacterium]
MTHRWIYLLLVLAIIVPLVHPLGLPVTPTTESQDLFDLVEKLPQGSLIYLAMDFDAGSIPELLPQAEAVFTHAMRRDLKVVIHGLSDQGVLIARDSLHPIAWQFGKTYGIDFVNLGFKPGGGIVLRGMTADLWKTMGGVDIDGKRLSDLPMMNGLRRLDRSSVALIVDFNSGGSAMAYRNYVTEPTGIPLALGSCAVNFNVQLPFYRSGQYKAILNGLRGAAEYEGMLGVAGKATSAMDAQSTSHALIVGLIVLGNLAYFLGGRQGGGPGRRPT